MKKAVTSQALKVTNKYQNKDLYERTKRMKRVITYGTFDLLHYGHIELLKRAKALGDYLIVVLSTDEFNWNEKQKISDVKEYHVDTFVMGDDWKGKFDFLKEYCEVVYLPRTPEISTTQIKQDLSDK